MKERKAVILLWCGHDCHPCAANTSILDINADPKPAALALAQVWNHSQKNLDA